MYAAGQRCFHGRDLHKLALVAVRENKMQFNKRHALQIAVAISLFISGVLADAIYTRNVSAQTRPAAQARLAGQPKSVVHVVVYKWKDTVSENDKEQVMTGLKTFTRKLPGVKNIWLKTQRNQLKDFSGVYAIEFASPEAAADYAESPAHEAWSKQWQNLRENSLSFQVSNP
jgi:cell division protein FtsX